MHAKKLPGSSEGCPYLHDLEIGDVLIDHTQTWVAVVVEPRDWLNVWIMVVYRGSSTMATPGQKYAWKRKSYRGIDDWSPLRFYTILRGNRIVWPGQA